MHNDNFIWLVTYILIIVTSFYIMYNMMQSVIPILVDSKWEYSSATCNINGQILWQILTTNDRFHMGNNIKQILYHLPLKYSVHGWRFNEPNFMQTYIYWVVNKLKFVCKLLHQTHKHTHTQFMKCTYRKAVK